MSHPLQRLIVLPQVAVLVGATHAGALSPWYPLLARYDREISALRHTLAEIPPDRIPSAGTRPATASSNASVDRAVERAALQAVLASRRARGTMDGYAAQLERETQATIASYARAIATRERRAYDARERQLREKESSLQFDLAQADGGERLELRLKLQDLHLDARRRAALCARLGALDASERRRVDAQRAADDVILASYGNRLQHDGDSSIAQMTETLRAKAAANLAIRRRAFAAETAADASFGDLPAKVRTFASSYRTGAAAAVAASLRSADRDISSQVRSLRARDERSRRETIAQIRMLQAQRAALYRAILAQTPAATRTKGSRHPRLGESRPHRR